MKLLKSITWMLMILLAIGFTGCSDDDDDSPTGPTTTDYFEAIVALGVDYFGNGTKNITGDGLWADMNDDAVELFIIDVRNASDWAAGHIEGAVNWPMGDLMDNLGQIPAGAKVVVTCYSGQTASQATAILRLLGYDAWNLKWGMCGWTDRGPWSGRMPTDGLEAMLSTETEVMPAEVDYPMVESDLDNVHDVIIELADAYFEDGTKNVSATDVMLGNNGFGSAFIGNYWPTANYDMGHLDGAVCFNTGDPTFKSLGLDALKYLPTDEKIVFYCFTGQTSSQITAFLRILGYDAYSMLFGMNDVTSDADHLSNVLYHAPEEDFPVIVED